MKIDDLPQVEQGDYGACIYEWKGRPLLVEYDDDDDWCSHDRTDDHVCGDLLDPALPPDSCYLDSGAIILTDKGQMTVSYCELRSFEPKISVTSMDASRKGGWVYAVAILPEIDLNRLKIGFTKRPIEKRMQAFRTANPTAMLVGLWEGNLQDEDRAHGIATGRIGESEVFQCDSVTETLEAIDRVLGVDR